MREKKELQNRGIALLIRQGKEMFRIPENINHYAPEDYLAAEKKFVKECIIKGNCRL